MRDKRWVAIHRGGQLTPGIHSQLMEWACRCAEHILLLYGPFPDQRLINALVVAKAWNEGTASVGEAREAAIQAHAVARESVDPVKAAVARAAGHAVATAHMADHALGPALYAIRAVRLAGKSVEDELNWQFLQLTPEIFTMVTETRAMKEKGSFKI